jgi:hypothetical protein
LAQLAAMPTAPPFIMGLTREVSQRFEVFDDLSGLITVLIALFRRFGVLLKLNARLTAMRVFDASLKRNICLFIASLKLILLEQNDLPGGSS